MCLRAGVTLRLGCGGRSHLRDLGGQWQSTAWISGSVQAPHTKILQVELDYARTQQHQRSKAIDRLTDKLAEAAAVDASYLGPIVP